MTLIRILFISLLLPIFLCGENKREILFFYPNTTQLFTELYQAYDLLNPPSRTFIENALYLDQATQETLLPMQPSNQAILDHANRVLSEYHKKVNDLELYIDPKKEKTFFYVASGAKHLTVALIYAIVMSEPNKKFVFAEQAPFYSGHPNAVTGIYHYPNARFVQFHDPSEISLKKGEVLVEFVTSPNNPDGKFRKPLTNAEIIIADLVFSSSAFGNDSTGYLEKNIEWIREARAAGKHIFSFNSASKQFGKTSARCGYIWFPLHDQYASSIFKNFFNYISNSTVGASTAGLAEFLNLIGAFLDLPDNGKTLRDDASKSLQKRHELVEKELLNKYPGSIVTSLPGSPTLFAKIIDKRTSQKKGSDILLDDVQVAVNSGRPLGETDEYIRINLSGYSEELVEFLNRLAGEKKYTGANVLFTTSKKCRKTTVFTAERHIVNPSDCVIECDASKGAIEIILPPFIDYEKSNIITFKKMDNTENVIHIKSDTIDFTLRKSGENIDLQWVQPSYLNGRWDKIIPKFDEV